MEHEKTRHGVSAWPHGASYVRVVLDEGAYCPTRAHETDAGLDLYAPSGFTLPAGGQAFVDTGVHVQLPPGTVGLVRSRSGLMRHGGVTTGGTIDEGYTGSVGVVLQSRGACNLEFSAGDKIAQLVIVPCCTPRVLLADELEETERGAGGFGSTGAR